jgi:hypothetical protein
MRIRTCLLLVLLAIGAARTARGGPAGLAGAYLLESDDDGAAPKAKATVTLTFTGKERGTLALVARQPGETVKDSGTYAVRADRITISFKELAWEAREQPFTLAACRLTLPFRALGDGPGTSTWRRDDPACAVTEAPLAPFSADVVISDGAGRERARLYATPAAIRVETRAGTTILRLDRRTVLTLAPGAKQAVASPLPVGDSGLVLVRNAAPPPGCRVTGRETVAGHDCERQECSATVGGQTLVERYLIADDLGGLVLEYSDGETSFALENVKPGPQDPKLFDAPVAASDLE